MKYVFYVNLADMNTAQISEYYKQIQKEFEKLSLNSENVAIIPVYEGSTRLEKFK